MAPELEVDFVRDALATLCDYVTIPCLSPAYDSNWQDSGHLDAAAELLVTWASSRAIDGFTISTRTLEGRTPVICATVEPSDPTCERTVLLYGHFDKQPPLGNWREGLAPFTPVIEGDRLYGRGAVDDGYAIFSSLLAIEAIQRAGLAHGRIVVLIEASEESGSPDLDAHVEALAETIGTPDVVICLDSGALTYDQLWLTQSLRGNNVVSVTVDVLDHGVHSGVAGGVVPSSFRIMRELLDRIEDSATGELLVDALFAEIPTSQRARLVDNAAHFGDTVADNLPTVPGLKLSGKDAAGHMIAQAWSPALSVTGVGGIPDMASAGNVLRPRTSLTLSFRLPPSVDAQRAMDAVTDVLSADPPHGAKVTVVPLAVADGWQCPEPAPWLTDAVDEASLRSFGKPAGWCSEGGTIPFLASLGQRFPGVFFVATGCLGPGSNAHGPDESLHLPTAQKITEVLAEILVAHATS